MHDEHKKFVMNIDLNRSRIKNLPSFVFLCGGQIGENNKSYKSVRHYIYSCIKDSVVPKSQIIRAEELISWYYSNYYDNLLDMEADLAGLAATIVLIVESPGAIAELGSFVLYKNIRNKLIIFMHSDHNRSESFIREGPIKLFKNHVDQSLYTYPWKSRKKSSNIDPSSISDFAPEIAKAIENRVHQQPQEKTFDSDDSSHLLLLIADLIDIYQAVRLKEIQDVLSTIFDDFSQKTTKMYLNILKNLKMIDSYDIGSDTYYISIKNNEFMSYGFLPSVKPTHKDRIRWKVRFREINSKKDLHKQKAIKELK